PALDLVDDLVVGDEEAPLGDVPPWRGWDEGRGRGCGRRVGPLGLRLEDPALRQPLDGLPELLPEVAAGQDAVALRAVERVLAAPGAQDLLGMIQEILVDHDLGAVDRQRSGR